MASSELALLGLSAVLNAALTAIVAYSMYRLRRFSKKWEEVQDGRVQAERERQEHRDILLGNDDISDELMPGLIHLVEVHDEELTKAAEERRAAEDERERLRKRVQRLTERAEDRTGER